MHNTQLMVQETIRSLILSKGKVPGPYVGTTQASAASEFYKAMISGLDSEKFSQTTKDHIAVARAIYKGEAIPSVSQPRKSQGRYMGEAFFGTLLVGAAIQAPRPSYVPNNNVGHTSGVSRLGQAAFSAEQDRLWGNKCPITGTTDRKFLEHAHLNAFAETHDNSSENGILIRKDLAAKLSWENIEYSGGELAYFKVLSNDPKYQPIDNTPFIVPLELREKWLDRISKH